MPGEVWAIADKRSLLIKGSAINDVTSPNVKQLAVNKPLFVTNFITNRQKL
jgi:hypothetical protein